MFDSLRNNSKIVVYIVVAAFIVTGGLMGFGSYMSNNNSSSASNSSSPYIAKVNDTGITPQQYMNVLRNQAPQRQLSSSQIIPFRLNVLNSMIERQLILEQADEMDIKAQVTDKDVEEKIEGILKNNDLTREELNNRLKDQNSSLDQFKKDLKKSMETNNKIQQTVATTYNKVEVTEEEIKKEYEKSNKEKDLAQVKDELKKQILNDKQNKAFNNWLENVKAESNIAINDPTLNAYYQLNNKNYDQAISLFDNIIESNPSPMMYIYLAQAYEGKKNQEQVIATYQQALEEYPDDWEVYYTFGNYYRNMEEKEKALAKYDKAAANAGEDLMAHYKLYMVYSALEAEDKAKTEMKKLTELQKKLQEQQQKKQSVEENNQQSQENVQKGDKDEN